MWDDPERRWGREKGKEEIIIIKKNGSELRDRYCHDRFAKGIQLNTFIQAHAEVSRPQISKEPS